MGKDKLMLTKDEIQKAIHESQFVKEKYPAFWKFFEMLLEFNNGMAEIEYSLRNKK